MVAIFYLAFMVSCLSGNHLIPLVSFYAIDRFQLLHSVGKPIIVQKVEEPTNKQVSELHKKYCRELSSLFDAHKQKYGIPATAKLEFV
jgi:2-acylglycerol O-acyltransferase 2